MASPRPTSPATRPLEVEITVVSAKHLKNVNWRHGDLKPYAVAYLDPERRSATKPDDAGSTRPVWNERLVLPLPFPLHQESPLVLTLDIFHSKPSETPKPLVGTARSPLSDLIDLEDPSGNPRKSARLTSSAPPAAPKAKFASGWPFASAPMCRSLYPYGNYSDPYSGYYSSTPGYFSAPPAPGAAGPSARPSYYDRSSGYALVGAVAGALGGLALEEGLKHEEGKITERVEESLPGRITKTIVPTTEKIRCLLLPNCYLCLKIGVCGVQFCSDGEPPAVSVTQAARSLFPRSTAAVQPFICPPQPRFTH
ncbi:hypothetical protein KSP39_PZI018360 [Platanthera zijinensis]|uniref:C2 domain-containing protein n=1 Tax=Platanthera zijinensis TaxID=2320716 RepID=A0AAP0FYT2_9ASPA